MIRCMSEGLSMCSVAEREVGGRRRPGEIKSATGGPLEPAKHLNVLLR